MKGLKNTNSNYESSFARMKNLKRIEITFEKNIGSQNNMIYLGYIILLVMVGTLVVMVLDMYFNKNLLINQSNLPQTIIIQNETK
ncbi:MAG: hypothetical protein R3B55_01085 [Candidatus Paceibacterota bacterium]